MVWSLRLAAGALALSSTACALVTADRPTVDVMDVRLVGLGLTEQQLAVTLCVTNPNPDQLAFKRVTAAMDVAGLPLAEGASDVPVLLPPRSSVAVPFTVVTTVQNIGPQLAGIVRDGGLNYRLHGTVTLAGGLPLTVPFSKSGRLDADMGAATLSSLARQASPAGCAAG